MTSLPSRSALARRALSALSGTCSGACSSASTRRALPGLLAAAALALAACGGGSSDGSVGGGGTGSPLGFAGGPISGFGSIIVNGVHYDDSGLSSAATDDGGSLATTALKLGMTVQIDSGTVSNSAATASAIHVSSDLVGPVSAVYDATAGTLGVMGQTVKITTATALDGLSGGAAGLSSGNLVVVYSLLDPATGVYVATRIDPQTAVSLYKVRGQVAALDTSAATFTLGTQTFNAKGVTLPAGLANGQIVAVQVLPVTNGNGQWVVSSFGSNPKKPADGQHAEIKGVVGSVTDATHYTVAGVTVDASAATLTPTTATIVVGARVEVEGRMSGTSLVANAVQVEAEGDDDHGGGSGGGGGGGGDTPIEITGALLADPDTVNSTFQVRGPTTVNYATASFSSGSAADLRKGVKVELKGAWSADGTQVVATQVKIDK